MLAVPGDLDRAGRVPGLGQDQALREERPEEEVRGGLLAEHDAVDRGGERELLVGEVADVVRRRTRRAGPASR